MTSFTNVSLNCMSLFSKVDVVQVCDATDDK